MASMRSRSPLARVRPGSPASTVWSLRVQMIRSPALACGAVGDGDGGAGLDDAEGDEVLADAAGQLAAQRVVGGHQQGVGAVGGEGDVGGRGGVHHLLRLPADGSGRAGRSRPGRWCRRRAAAGWRPVPRRRGTGPARRGGRSRGRSASRAMPPPFSTACSCWVSPARITLAPLAAAWLMTSARSGLEIMDASSSQDQVAGPQRDGAAGAALAGQVAQELGGVVGLRDPGGQGVAGRLGRRDADDPAEPGRRPRLARRGQHPRLAGPGGRVDHRDAPAVGQHRQRGGGLILAQPGARARAACASCASVRAAGQRGLELRQVRAERPRGVARGSCAARRRRAPARACAPPGTAARAWRTARRRAAGRCCARRRAASCAGTSAGSGASRQATGSNSERSARSARSSSSAAAAAGSLPVRGRTRPRYLITSARVQALFSCWASATAFCAARAQLELG